MGQRRLSGLTALIPLAGVLPALARVRSLQGYFVSVICPGLLHPGLLAKQGFEVASMKPSGISPSRMEVTGGPETSSPGRYTCNHCPLKFLLRSAYGVDSDQISGPSWIETEQYDVMAILPAHTDKPQFRRMMQILLQERVALRVRIIARELPGFDLTVGSHGARLRRSSSTGDADINASLRAPRVKDAEGFPVLPRGFDGPLTTSVAEGSRWRLYRRANESMDQLADFLRGTLKVPVRNRTGLAGKYETHLSYEMNVSDIYINGVPVGPTGDSDPQTASSTLAATLDKRLGLKLLPAKVSVDTIVVEHVEKKPAVN